MRTYTKSAKEETGKAPACTGALLEITGVKRVYVKEGPSDWSQTYAGCAQYQFNFRIKAPKGAAGLGVTDRIMVGNPDDKEAKRKETWEVTEGGPARLVRLMRRAGIAMVEDDEEWMADAIGKTVVAPIVVKGEYANVGLYYRESDKDCPEIALADAKGGKAKKRVVEEPEDEEEEETAEADDEVDEEEEEKPAKRSGKKPKPAPKDEDEEEDEDVDDDEDDDEPAPKAKKAGKKPKPSDDDDEDEDDD